jgi:hypothetical protein
VQKYNEGLRRFVDVAGGVRAFLNSICSGLEMPWTLRDMPDAKIIELLKNRCGIEDKIAAIDGGIKEKETLRTEAGRDRKRLGDPGKAPEKAGHPYPIDEIKAEREKARMNRSVYEETLGAVRESVQKSLAGARTFEDLKNICIQLRQEIATGQDRLIVCKLYTKAEIEALDNQIAKWYEIEEKAKKYDAYLEKKKQCDDLDKLYADLTAEIEILRDNRKKILQDMNLGVKGLEIREDNRLYHNDAVRGITDTQKSCNWSTAESVQVFFGLGARFAGNLKVLCVDNAESLDKKTTKAITAWAESAGFLVILLRVAEFPETMEDGIIYVKEGEVLAK